MSSITKVRNLPIGKTGITRHADIKFDKEGIPHINLEGSVKLTGKPRGVWRVPIRRTGRGTYIADTEGHEKVFYADQLPVGDMQDWGDWAEIKLIGQFPKVRKKLNETVTSGDVGTSVGAPIKKKKPVEDMVLPKDDKKGKKKVKTFTKVDRTDENGKLIIGDVDKPLSKRLDEVFDL